MTENPEIDPFILLNLAGIEIRTAAEIDENPLSIREFDDWLKKPYLVPLTCTFCGKDGRPSGLSHCGNCGEMICIECFHTEIATWAETH